jgi:OOP family OmpA-OmpF porin
MKKIIAISAVVAALFATDYQVGVGFGRAHTDKYDGKYNFLNLRGGAYLSKYNLLRLELERSTNYDFKNPVSKNNLTRALLNIEHDIDINSKLTPYAFIGTGYQWVSGNDKNAMVLDVGIGAKYNLNRKLDLFAEARALRDFGIDKNHIGFLGGIVYNFGSEEPESTPVNEEVKVIDSDGDGVPDNLDKCPNTLKGMKVDKNGCAISFDFKINFDTNSYRVKPQYLPRIKEFAEFLKQHPEIKAQIQGHTDNRGKYEYNMLLSKKRAKAVYDELIKLGVNKDQINWAGYGPNNPITSNDTPEGRAKNRRVVAKIIY